MAGWVASGRALDVILAGMVLEGLLLVALWRTRGLGLPPADLLPNLLAGMGLLLGMRLALAGQWWGWVSLALLAALGCHLLWLRRNWGERLM